MKPRSKNYLLIFSLLCCLCLSVSAGFAQELEQSQGLDQRVENFLKSQRGKWRHSNVPRADARVLYDLIIKNNYKRALEIGTSTGHSAIWIAWALSKTGGKLITIEINRTRYNMALENFKKAGLSDYIEARLANAHDLVPQLEGPFDFVFLDADKDWNQKYLELLLPKLEVGGCFTAHNVVNLGYMRGIKEFLEYVRSLPNMETTIDRTSWTGISISYKTSD
ncbi:MAG: methyltransferase [Candidatus Aminicenantes bacterium]|nr:methyltransferase [Candidatus Aminicenantes bacterium]